MWRRGWLRSEVPNEGMDGMDLFSGRPIKFYVCLFVYCIVFFYFLYRA